MTFKNLLNCYLFYLFIQDIQSSCEPPSFSLERLLFSIVNDTKTQPETLQKILPLIQNIRYILIINNSL